MNFSTIALALLAWQLLVNKGNPTSNKTSGNFDVGSLAGLLSPDAKNLMDNIGAITNKSAESTDKTGAIINLLTNPSVMQFASGLFGNGKTNVDPAPTKKDTDSDYSYDKGTPESRDFFAPIDHVAGKEVSSKLYQMYDNWYSNKKH